jgi:hypothetical protein
MTRRNVPHAPGGLSSNHSSDRTPSDVPGVVRLSGTPGASGTFTIGSRSRPGAHHQVAITPERVVCSCPGYAWRRACWHVAVVAAELERERRQQQAARYRAAERLEEIAEEFGL